MLVAYYLPLFFKRNGPLPSACANLTQANSRAGGTFKRLKQPSISLGMDHITSGTREESGASREPVRSLIAMRLAAEFPAWPTPVYQIGEPAYAFYRHTLRS